MWVSYKTNGMKSFARGIFYIKDYERGDIFSRFFLSIHAPETFYRVFIVFVRVFGSANMTIC